MGFQEWIGRQETIDDLVTPTPIAALSATLNWPSARPPEGSVLPPLWHWLYFLPLAQQSEIGEDGHPRRGGFLPPVPLPQLLATDSAPVDMLEGTFNYAWVKLQELIANGDKAALQMYLNSALARSVMDAMVEQQKSDFGDLSDEELVERLLVQVSDEELVAEVERRGLA